MTGSAKPIAPSRLDVMGIASLHPSYNLIAEIAEHCSLRPFRAAGQTPPSRVCEGGAALFRAVATNAALRHDATSIRNGSGRDRENGRDRNRFRRRSRNLTSRILIPGALVCPHSGCFLGCFPGCRCRRKLHGRRRTRIAGRGILAHSAGLIRRHFAQPKSRSIRTPCRRPESNPARAGERKLRPQPSSPCRHRFRRRSGCCCRRRRPHPQ